MNGGQTEAAALPENAAAICAVFTEGAVLAFKYSAVHSAYM